MSIEALINECRAYSEAYIEAAEHRGRSQARGDKAEDRARGSEDHAFDRFLSATNRLAAMGENKLANKMRLDTILAATYAARDALSEALAAMKAVA